jgi:hypothetical protein
MGWLAVVGGLDHPEREAASRSCGCLPGPTSRTPALVTIVNPRSSVLVSTSHLVMLGVQLKAVQELMGHSTIQMTMRYAHLAPSVPRKAVKLLDRKSANRAPTQQAE